MKNLTLDKIRTYLLAALVVGAPLSFVPSVATPLLNFPSFRVGLYQVLAVIFVTISIIPVLKAFKTLYFAHKPVFIALLVFGALSVVGLLWATSIGRSTLMVFSVLLLLGTLVTAWWVVQAKIHNIPKVFLDILLWSGIIFGILAITQLIYGTFYDSGGFLCKGCSSNVFGFPRVNVSTAEPLFFANALLPVMVISFIASLKKYKLGLFSLVFTSLAIGLTFSRGAYFALALGLMTVVILTVLTKKVSIKPVIISLLLVGMSLFSSILLLTTSATVRLQDTTPNITYTTVQSIADHLSLGVVQLPDKTVVITTPQANDPTDDFTPPGLIEESTTERLSSADLAIEAWSFSVKNILIGTGLGNLGGFVVNNVNQAAPSTLTVYIFYILLLAELGIIGLLAFLTIIGYILYKLTVLARNNTLAIIVFGVVAMFGLQYLFFGSYINVVYIWLWLGIALGAIVNQKLDVPDIIYLGNKAEPKKKRKSKHEK